MTDNKTHYLERLSRCFTVVTSKAVELGYPIEAMKITLSPSEPAARGVTAHFSPVPAPGTFVTGGGLTIEVDLVDQVITNLVREQ